VWIEAQHFAVAQKGVEDRRFPSALRCTEEQPVLLADGTGTNRVFNQIVVNLHSAILQIHAEPIPHIECVGDRFTEPALRQYAGLEFVEGFADSVVDHRALAGTNSLAQAGSGAGFS